MGKGEFGVLGMEQRIADEVRERTRPQGEENIACRYRCVGNKVFDPFKLAWEDCPLCAGLLVKKLGLSEDATEDEVLARFNIPNRYKGRVLDVRAVIAEDNPVRGIYTAESLRRIEEVLEELTELVYSGKGPSTTYFLNVQTLGLESFIYPYMMKAIRMGLSVSPYIPVTKYSLMAIGLNAEPYRAYLRRLSFTDMMNAFGDQDVYFNNLQQQGHDLARFYQTNLEQLTSTDVLFIEIPLSVSSSDLVDLQELVRERDSKDKGTVIVSNFGRSNSTIRKSLQSMFFTLDQKGIEYKEIDVRPISKISSGGNEDGVVGTAMDVLNKFQVNTGLL